MAIQVPLHDILYNITMLIIVIKLSVVEDVLRGKREREVSSTI
jgi:hypothetical protein